MLMMLTWRSEGSFFVDYDATVCDQRLQNARGIALFVMMGIGSRGLIRSSSAPRIRKMQGWRNSG